MRVVLSSAPRATLALILCLLLTVALPSFWPSQSVAAAQVAGGTAPWFREGGVSCARIALVFNIGIGETPSETILNTLIDKEVDATMFPMGSFAHSQPEYLRRLNDAGFEIGTHGHQNLFLTGATSPAIRRDIRDSVEAIEGVIGREIEPYHTPYAGDTDLRVRALVDAEGLLPVGWGVAAPDWSDDATEDAVYRRVIDNVYPGAIVEMHLDGPATEQSTALALPRLVEELRAGGYEFVTIGEMLEPCESAHQDLPETVTMSGLDVHGLHCRTAPSAGSTLIRILMNGDIVGVRGSAFAGWMPVECARQNGWVKAEYLLEHAS